MQSIASLKHLCAFRSSAARWAQIHSAPILLGKGKWGSKWDPKGREGHQIQPKSYAKYVTRCKRAESKKALKDYYIHGLEPQSRAREGFASSSDYDEFARAKTYNKGHQTSSRHQRGERSKSYSRYKKHGFRVHDFVRGDAEFASNIGDDEEFKWYGKSSEDFFGNQSSRFHYSSDSRRARADGTSSSYSKEEESSDYAGAHSHRRTLGLPSSGPLTIRDIKAAFHEAALKWHPDKHPDTSQNLAEEKFKECVNAYDALCADLKPA